MSSITIDGIEHNAENFNKDQLALFNAIQYCDAKLADLDNQLAAMKTARQAYVNDLGHSLKDG
jgi:hypothetical protein|tara:strand:+ start:81 stop:269 length:189 start_codon:yes stop_codon:yes gene_type:complete